MTSAEVGRLRDRYLDCYRALRRPAEAYLNIGREYAKQGDAEQARAFLERAMELSTRDGQPDLIAEVHYTRWAMLSSQPQRSGAAAERRPDDTTSELQKAMRSRPASSRYRLVWAVQQLSRPSVHAAQLVAELERGLELELQELGHGTAAPQSHAGGSAAAPATRAHLLFLWALARALHPAVLTRPALAAQWESLREPQSPVARTPCDLERGGALLTAADSPHDALMEAGAMAKPRSVLISPRVRVNAFGVPVPV